MRLVKIYTSTRLKQFRFNHPASGLFVLAVIIMVFCWNPLRAQPLEVERIQHMDFGTFATGSSGGTVVISPEGNRSVTGTVVGLDASNISSAKFLFTVSGNRIVSLIFPEQTQLTRSAGGSMTITNFTSDMPGNQFQTYPPLKTYYVNVGATLNVQNSTVNPGGRYTGEIYFTATFIKE